MLVETRRVCRRCLLGDMPDASELSRAIAERIALMPEEARADAETVARRLAVCRACDHLMNGGCALCGCYVELRTAKAAQRCPDVPPRWLPER